MSLARLTVPPQESRRIKFLVCEGLIPRDLPQLDLVAPVGCSMVMLRLGATLSETPRHRAQLGPAGVSKGQSRCLLDGVLREV